MFGLCADNWESPIWCGQYTSRAPTAQVQDIYKWHYFYLYIKPLFTLYQIKQFVLLQGRTIWIWYVGRVKKASVDTALLGICGRGFPKKWYEQNYLIPLMSTAMCGRHHLGAQSRLYRD